MIKFSKNEDSLNLINTFVNKVYGHREIIVDNISEKHLRSYHMFLLC